MSSECGDEKYLTLGISVLRVMFYSITVLIGLHVIIENKEVTAVSGFLHAWDLEGSRDVGSSSPL